MDMLDTVIISGVMTGLIYSLIALGFVLIFKASHVFNLAQGEFLLFGACIGWVFASLLNLNIWLTLALTVLCSGILGFLIEYVLIQPLISQPLFASIMLTLALSMTLKGILIGIWWAPPYGYPSSSFLEFKLPQQLSSTLISPLMREASIIALVLIVVFLLFFNFTRVGLSMRAVAEDYQVAQALGINVRRIITLTWIIAAIVAGIGGLLLGRVLTVSGELSTLGLVVLPVALLGGLDSIFGCIVGGIIIGIAENVAAIYLDPLLPRGGGLRIVFPYVIMLCILVIRPEGLFGLKRIERI